MKKTNFVVIFWLVLALISFVTLLVQLSGFWRNIAGLIIPYSNNEYVLSVKDIQRDLLENIPMLLISGTFFVFFMKKGLKLYHSLSNELKGK